MYFVYIIYSNQVGKIYIGHTDNIERRLFEHNNGLLGAYRKNKGPWALIHSEEFETRSAAIQIERYLKSGVGMDWVKHHFGIYKGVTVRRGGRTLLLPTQVKGFQAI